MLTRAFQKYFTPTLFSVCLFLLFSLVFAFYGANPIDAILKMARGSLFSAFGIRETITKAIPLILMATALALCFKGNFWNIGADGQFLSGAIAVTWVALNFGDTVPSYVLLPLLFVAGFVGGAISGLLIALLKTRFGINEVISSLMFNYILAELTQYFVYGPWRGKTQWGFPYTDDFSENGWLPQLANSRIHYPTLILALISAGFVHLLLEKSKFGFEIKIAGESSEAAKYAGINFTRVFSLLMIFAGGICGLAGTGELCGIHHHLSHPQNLTSGYGFTAIIVASLAGFNPLKVILFSVLMAALIVGGDVLQTSFSMPFGVINIFNGLILLYVSVLKYFKGKNINNGKVV